MSPTLSSYASTQRQQLEQAFNTRYRTLLPLLENSGLTYRVTPGPHPLSDDSTLLVFRRYPEQLAHYCTFSVAPNGHVSNKSHGAFTTDELTNYLAGCAASWDKWQAGNAWRKRTHFLKMLNDSAAIAAVGMLAMTFSTGLAWALGATTYKTFWAALAGTVVFGGLAVWSKRRLNRSERQAFPDGISTGPEPEQLR